MLIFVAFSLLLSVAADAQGCVPRRFKSSSVVCVCNATYCDGIPEIEAREGVFVVYTSSRDGLRFQRNSEGRFGAESNVDAGK